MSNLDTKAKNFNIILNIPKTKNIDILKLCDFFDSQCYYFALIKHDKDYNRNGMMKTIHYHIVLKCASWYRVSTMLYKIGDCLELYTTDELNAISIQKCDSLPLAIQYLTHKNNAEKYQYNFDEIISNFNADDLKEYYEYKGDTEINVKYLVNLVKQGFSDFEIMSMIGLGRYHLYKGAINDIRYALQRNPNSVDQFLLSLDNVK